MTAIQRLLVLGVMLFPASVLAWGGEGHRITGHIAEALLTPKARIRLHQITGGATLDQLSTYMDEHKNELGPRVRKWHYDNAPVCATAPIAAYCPTGDCASQQIERLERVLGSPTSTVDEKREAVVFLSHLVGDIHQPLHAADNGDKGGNEIYVEGRGGYSKNLHKLWDSDFVKRALRGSSEAVYAERLRTAFADRIPGWQQGRTVDWMAESRGYAIQEAYGMLEGFSCNGHGSPAAVAITPAYRAAAEKRVQEQLVKGGARLAYMVNQLLDPPN